jgi:hypothetical protein
MWLGDYHRKKGSSPKLRKKFKGPFKIAKKLSEVLYEVLQCNGPYHAMVHYNRIKPYFGVVSEHEVTGTEQETELSTDSFMPSQTYYPSRKQGAPRKKKPMLPRLPFRRRVGYIVRLWAPGYVNASLEQELNTVRTKSSVKDTETHTMQMVMNTELPCAPAIESVSFETGQAPESSTAEDNMGQGGRPQITIRRPVWQEGYV